MDSKLARCLFSTRRLERRRLRLQLETRLINTGRRLTFVAKVGYSVSTDLLYRRKSPKRLRWSLHCGSQRTREAMEIGDPLRTVTVEPLEEPVPRELPDEPPEEDPVELPREPENVPA
jgi:hypothetical protein